MNREQKQNIGTNKAKLVQMYKRYTIQTKYVKFNFYLLNHKIFSLKQKTKHKKNVLSIKKMQEIKKNRCKGFHE